MFIKKGCICFHFKGKKDNILLSQYYLQFYKYFQNPIAAKKEYLTLQKDIVTSLDSLFIN